MLEKSCTDAKLDDFGEDLSIVCSFFDNCLPLYSTKIHVSATLKQPVSGFHDGLQ